jgi:hypothetical protein
MGARARDRTELAKILNSDQQVVPHPNSRQLKKEIRD